MSEMPTADNDADRCPYLNTYMRATRPGMREDGWRCGESVSRPHNHVLYTAEGEGVLDQVGPWALPSPSVIPPAPPAPPGPPRVGGSGA